MRRSLALVAFVAATVAVVGLVFAPRSEGALPAKAAPSPLPSALPPTTSDRPALDNLAAYIPAQCYAVTQDASGGRPHNGCFACHQQSLPPNYVDDPDVQTSLSLPRFATVNRWTNLLHPPPPAALPEAELLSWVRRSNYLDEHGAPRLAATLVRPPAAWDTNGNGTWDGFTPDCYFRADEQGYDRAPDGRATGWRAYAYVPMPGLFWPTNGSAADAFIRLPEAYRQDATGQESEEVYSRNLAILEAFLRRVDVPIPATDERALGADLDGDGRLGQAVKVAFVWPPKDGKRLHYVGRASALDPEKDGFPAAGLYPNGTELLHSVRYLDVDAGQVRMAARMKELRYMRKIRWRTYSDLDLAAKAEMREKARKPDRLKLVMGDAERGIATGTGWRMQAFIEDASGDLRPQTVEETTACIGCHGGTGATVDSTFSLARKLGADAPAAGWYPLEGRGVAGIPEPRRADGRGEYEVWLEQVGGGDDFRSNTEVEQRFFGAGGKLKPEMVRALAKDISVLIVPSPERALALDRGYLALVKAQSFEKGRDVILGTPHLRDRAAQDDPTGIEEPVTPPWKAMASAGRRAPILQRP
jgi:hypothetical protein